MKSVYPILALLLLTYCTSKKADDKPAVDPVAYQSEIDAWHEKREANLKGPKAG